MSRFSRGLSFKNPPPPNRISANNWQPTTKPVAHCSPGVFFYKIVMLPASALRPPPIPPPPYTASTPWLWLEALCELPNSSDAPIHRRYPSYYFCIWEWHSEFAKPRNTKPRKARGECTVPFRVLSYRYNTHCNSKFRSEDSTAYSLLLRSLFV